MRGGLNTPVLKRLQPGLLRFDRRESARLVHLLMRPGSSRFLITLLAFAAVVAASGGRAWAQEALTNTTQVEATPSETVELNLTADAPMIVDGQTREVVARDNARVEYGEWTLVADEIRYHQADGRIEANGNIVATRPGLRILGDSARYNANSGQIEVSNFRFGQPPLHAQGERGYGTAEAMTFENVEIFYGEPGRFTPRARINELKVLGEDNRFEADRLRISIGDLPMLALSGLVRPLAGPRMIVESRAGYDGNTGLQLGLGAYYPYSNGFNPGGSIDIFTSRGVLFGPGARYEMETETMARRGSTDLAYIRDGGDRENDVLGRPVDKDRFFWTWEHVERHDDDRWTLNGELNWWSDSEVIRDFRDNDFRRRQDPDTFLEASLNGPGYIVSAFTRLRPNDYQVMAERLPEVRFDLLPMPLADTGALFELKAGAAILREDPPGDIGPELRSDRLDIYAGLDRSFQIGKGVTITPVAGGRLTHYNRALGDKANYTRWLGEVGFDASLKAHRVKELKSPLWGINGLRHIVEPRLEYRYVPEANRGRDFIPPVDRRAFLTQLQPLGLADRRDIDALGEIHAMRLSLLNLVETRREDYGSRELLRFSLGGDVFFSDTDEPGERDYSDLHADLRLTPADWLDAWMFLRFDPDDFSIDELNTRIALIDGDAWQVGIGTDFLRDDDRDDLEQFQVFGRYQLTEAYDIEAGARYDARENRFNEILLGFRARISQLWQIRASGYFRDGPRRESNLGVRFSIRFLEL